MINLVLQNIRNAVLLQLHQHWQSEPFQLRDRYHQQEPCAGVVFGVGEVLTKRIDDTIRKQWTETCTHLKSLVEILIQHHHRPSVFILLSSTDIYAVSAQQMDENSPLHQGEWARYLQKMEAALQPLQTVGIRVVCLRLSEVLFDTVARSEWLRVGNGSELISWIHCDDLCSIIDMSLRKSHMVGTYNLMSPQHISKHRLRPRGFTRLPRLASKMMLGEEVYAQVCASRKLVSNRKEHFSACFHKRYFSHILGSRYIFTNDSDRHLKK